MKRRLRNLKKTSAFTLVELLVVVAIIALLIAMLLPSLRNARQQAKQVVCRANLREQGLAWQMYLQEHNGAFLQAVNVNYNYGGAQGSNQLPWPGQTAPIRKPLNTYLKLDPVLPAGVGSVFQCPSDKGGGEAAPSNYVYYGTSYMTNMMLIAPDEMYIDLDDPVSPVLEKVNLRLPKLTVSRVDTCASALLLAADAGWWYSASYSLYVPRVEWHGKPGMHNVAFLDGHAAGVRFRKGLYVAPNYELIPFRDLAREAVKLQVEVLEGGQ